MKDIINRILLVIVLAIASAAITDYFPFFTEPRNLLFMILLLATEVGKI